MSAPATLPDLIRTRTTIHRVGGQIHITTPDAQQRRRTDPNGHYTHAMIYYQPLSGTYHAHLAETEQEAQTDASTQATRGHQAALLAIPAAATNADRPPASPTRSRQHGPLFIDVPLPIDLNDKESQP